MNSQSTEQSRVINRNLALLLCGCVIVVLIFVRIFQPEGSSSSSKAPEPATELKELLALPNEVVVIGWDGANWSQLLPLLESGRLPTLTRLMHHGSYGHLETLLPTISPMIWTSVATGKRPEKHGITDFTVEEPDTGQRVPATGQMRKTQALWNLLSFYEIRVGVVNWWTTWPAEAVHGFILSDMAAMGRRKELEKKSAWERNDAASVSRIYYPPEIQEVEQDIAWNRTLGDELSRFAKLLSSDQELLDRIGSYEPGNPLSVFKYGYLSDRYYLMNTLNLFKKRMRPDLLMYYVNSTDALSHVLWKYSNPEGFSCLESDQLERFSGTLNRYYEWIDEELGKLLSYYPEDVNVILLSDHGMIGMPDVTTGVKQLISARHTDHALVVTAGRDFKRDRIFVTRKIEGEHFERWQGSINYQEMGYRNLFPGGWMETVVVVPDGKISLEVEYEIEGDAALEIKWDDRSFGKFQDNQPCIIHESQGLHRLRLQCIASNGNQGQIHPAEIPWTAARLNLTRPNLPQAGKDWGYSLWQGVDSVWHLRWTAYTGILFERNPVFSGTLVCAQGFQRIQSVPESGDPIVQSDGTTISFQQTWSGDYPDAGVDFIPRDSVMVDLLIDGDRYPRMVYLDSTPRIKVDRIRIKSDEDKEFGSVPSVLDITPTVLTLFGLPTAKDMDGRSWDEALLSTVVTNRSLLEVMSYESLPRGDSDFPPEVSDSNINYEQMKKLEALGYIGSSP